MSETSEKFPGIVVNTDAKTKIPETVYLHLDQYEEEMVMPKSGSYYIYLFKEEDDRIDELEDVLDELKEEYIYATGIVWPDWVSEEIENLETETLDSLAWMIWFGETPEPEDVEIIREHQ